MIDDSNSSPAGQMSPNSGYGINSKHTYDEHQARMEYNMPGILHFLQTEWAKFEMERAQWDVERAELQARIAFLQGERKGQENLKQDLVRRIKMLEFALRQERAKYQKLQYGVDKVQQQPAPNHGTQSSEDEYEESIQLSNTTGPVYRQGRQLLKHYLEEIGYTDALLDVRSSRVRSLLGIHTDKDLSVNTAITGSTSSLSSKDPAVGVASHDTTSQDSRNIVTAAPVKSEPVLLTAETSDEILKVGLQLSYLPQQSGTVVDDADDSDEEDSQEDGDEEDDDDVEERRRIAASLPSGGTGVVVSDVGGDADDDDDSLEEAEALAEFDFLVSESSSDDGRTDGDGSEWSRSTDWPMDQQQLSKQIEQYKKERQKKHERPRKHDLKAMIATLGGVGEDGQTDDIDGRGDLVQKAPSGGEMMMRFPPGSSLDRQLGTSGLGLGDLADITVSNDIPDSLEQYNIGVPDSPTRKNWDAKYTLRSHFDGIRALTFHPVEPVLLTASEDHTMKLWNLQKTVPTKKPTALDVEPVYTFRAHQGPVLCVAMSATGEECFSGGVDSTIRCWNLPSSSIDPYDSYDSSILQDTLYEHTDAVWGLAIHSTKVQLLSCSADGTVRLWSPGLKMQLCHTFTPPSPAEGVPTCIDFLSSDPNHMMAAYSSGNAFVFDLTTGQQVLQLESMSTEGSPRINRIVSHPTLPVAISAHENRSIKFYDSTTGKLIHNMVAHLDAVTSLAVDPNGLYLLSGSHDCSIRLWSMENKTCVQEITSHRKKLDESIFDVAFHPSKPYIGSAGADGVAKVLV